MSATADPAPSLVPRPPARESEPTPDRHWKGPVIAVVALLIGVLIGSAGSAAKQRHQINAHAAQIAELDGKNAALQKQVDDRAAATEAENAHADAVKADREASARAKAAASAKAKADAAARAKPTAAAKAKAAAAARAKAAADAKARAAAAVAAAAAKKNTIERDGLYAIAQDVNPGRWRTGGGIGCYYAILNSPDTRDIATNNITFGPAIADLPLGKFFQTTGCERWTHA